MRMFNMIRERTITPIDKAAGTDPETKERGVVRAAAAGAGASSVADSVSVCVS